ncbi:ATP synthase subunit-domain-containing protein, partial [Jimgerdemannia flammicorona]
CETLEDLRLQLSATDYGSFLQNEPSPISTSTIGEKAIEKLVREFEYLRGNTIEPLTKFLDYIIYAYMIDNMILLIMVELMGLILEFEADWRTINITINSFGTELTKDDRQKLFPTIGRLNPDSNFKLRRADDIKQIKNIVKLFHEYHTFFNLNMTSGQKALEDKFFEYKFHYAIFYTFVKLKEQEV